jgi:signal transduction histidine kinase
MASASKFIDFFVHDLLDYTILNKDAKNFIKNPTIFDINKALLEMCEILEDKSKMKNIEIDIKFKGFEDNNTMVKSDKKRMQQVILNLMSNALKFTDREGKIMLLVEKIMRDSGEFLRISVVDSGVGIKEEDKSRLFKMFGSIKDEGKKINVHGVGLGLVICKMIVNKFDGYIDFVSKYKKGSTFFFTMKLDVLDQISEV